MTKHQVSRPDLILSLMDGAVRNDTVYREFGNAVELTNPERIIWDRWNALAEAYLAGLGELRDEVATRSWPNNRPAVDTDSTD